MAANSPRSFNTEGIVVRTRNLGEADRIVTLLTPDRGLVGCVARGARRPKSKVGGQTDLLRHITASLRAGRSDLHIISQVETVNAFLNLQTDLDRMTLASHMAEVSQQFSTEGIANPELFAHLHQSLGHAESAPLDTLPLLRLWHDVVLLTVSGWEPELYDCVRTGARLTEGDHWWSALEGGVVTQGYTELVQQRAARSSTQPAATSTTQFHDDPTLSYPLIPAPVSAIKLLRYIGRIGTDWHTLSRLRASVEQTESAQTLITRLMSAVAERPESRSARVAREVGA